MVDVCTERGLFLANNFFQHKMIHCYIWKRREEGGDEKSLIDYIAVDEIIIIIYYYYMNQ